MATLTSTSAIAGILSMHANGYVRQFAVKALSKFTDGSEIPFLLLRLSDWVPQVSAEAVLSMQQRLTRLAQIIPHITLYQHIKKRPRLSIRRDLC
jgi:hypothetical protein